jgi:oxygen-independent coproporphyrinogen-3 oxidase
LTADGGRLAARSLYLHIPFCNTHCPYCDFAIHIGGDHLHQPYVEAVITELGYLAAAGRPDGGLDTVYLGGGTPGLIDPALLGHLLQAVERRFGINEGAEITIEANPTGLTEDLCRTWLALGINRLSLGVQSLDDRALRWLGRNHDSATAEQALGAATKSGLENLSCDLMYAIPEQSTSVFAAGLERLLGHLPQHVSCYELTVEPATPLARSVARGRVSRPIEHDFLEQHRVASGLLEEAGLRQYEVSNYARPGRESRHNLGYWQGRNYLAAGCGAHGFVDRSAAQPLGFTVDAGAVGIRYWNLRSAATYIKQVAGLGHGRKGHEAIDGDQAELERLACGLRLRAGVELRLPHQLAEADRLAGLGLLTIEGQMVAATARGIEVLDRLTLELVASEPVSARG